jgi:hypothetical protein
MSWHNDNCQSGSVLKDILSTSADFPYHPLQPADVKGGNAAWLFNTCPELKGIETC